MAHNPFLSALAQLYPPEDLLTQAPHLLVYESDALTGFRVRPLAVVLPTTAEQVIETVRLCHAHGVPFVARGSGTSLSGGSLPVAHGIVIALNRLNRILKLDPEQRTAVVEPGVVNLRITEAAAPYGLYYAPDPSSQPVCTIGGNVALKAQGVGVNELTFFVNLRPFEPPLDHGAVHHHAPGIGVQDTRQARRERLVARIDDPVELHVPDWATHAQVEQHRRKITLDISPDVSRLSRLPPSVPSPLSPEGSKRNPGTSNRR